MKGKIVVLLVGMALLVGMLSGCTQQEEPEPTNTAPEASFTTVVNDTTRVVEFTDTSTDADGDTIASWSWDFGDTIGTSTEQNPTYTYTADGTYSVILTVNDGTDDGTITQTVEVNVTAVPTGPTAGFTYLPATVVNGTQVNFTDASTAGDVAITGWLWDLGDGTNSTDQNPTHTYTATGDVTVKLTVTDEGALTSESEQTVTVTAVAAE
jgi:PKD repeat protein